MLTIHYKGHTIQRICGDWFAQSCASEEILPVQSTLVDTLTAIDKSDPFSQIQKGWSEWFPFSAYTATENSFISTSGVFSFRYIGTTLYYRIYTSFPVPRYELWEAWTSLPYPQKTDIGECLYYENVDF